MKRIFIIIAIFVIFIGCSEKRDIADVKVSTHPEGWVKENAAGEHAEYLAQTGYNLSSCASCHGEDFAGGSSGVSCYSCHENFPHPEGFGDKQSPTFHSLFIKTNDWNIQGCAECHGQNYDVVKDDKSCRSCHTQNAGPLACTTCHGEFGQDVSDNYSSFIAPPEDLNEGEETTDAGVGAHQLHLTALKYSNPIACQSCHIVPQTVFDVSHIEELPAEVVFDTLATHNGQVQPVWTHETLTCENVYCHGNFTFYKDSSSYSFIYADSVMTGNNPSIIWNKVDGSQIQCGSCHDLPPKGHATFASCNSCHNGYNPAANQVNLEKHINGKIDVFY